MIKIMFLFSALVAIAAAKPSVPVSAALFAAPAISAPAPIVTATSSQYYHRINSGLAAYEAAPAPYVAAAPYIAAPYVAAPYVAAPYVAAPYVAAPAAAPIVAV